MSTPFDQRIDRSGGHFWLKELFTPERNRQEGLVSYAGADFEFPTCPALCRSVADAAARSMFGFNLPHGEYLKRVSWWMKTVRGCDMEPDWLVTTHGTIFALATAIRMATEPGENIMILTPGYNRYEQAATRLGRGTVKVPLSDGNGRYFMDWAALEAAMSQADNRLLVLCHPNNPTGHAYTREELQRVAELSVRHGVTVFSDEIFADVAFGSEPITPYVEAAGADAQAISCTSLGKAFSLTGVNHANVLIRNAELRERYITQRNADHYGSIDPLHAAAVMGAYTEEGRAWLGQMCSYVQENTARLRAFLGERLPGAVMTQPDGTFVVWVDFEPAGMTGADVQRLIVEEGCFTGDPGGDYYGREACMRFSLAVPRAELERSLAYLAHALEDR